MMKFKSKKEEFKFFNNLSNEWWNENGKFAVLHKIRPIRMKYILDNFPLHKLKNAEVLDIGCGGGLISESMCRLGAKVTGIDFAKNNVEVAKLHSIQNGLKIKYFCYDVEKIEFKKKYDLIIIFEVLEHLDNWKLFLNKICKNLKPHGKIIISTINRTLTSRLAAIYIAENILKWIPKNTHDYNKFIKPEEIKKNIPNNEFNFYNLKGLIYLPILDSWEISKNINNVNYFCTIEKVN